MDRIYLNELFDIYGILLTEHEQNVFIDYYEQDLSLSEISINNDVTRSAISKTLKNINNKLLVYENKLHIYYKQKSILKYLADNDIDKIKKLLGE